MTTSDSSKQKTTKNATKTSSNSGAKAGTWKKDVLKGGVAVIALTAALSYNFVKHAVTDLGLFLGPVQSFNTAGCEVVQGLEACEDVHIHHASGLAFTTCGNAEARKSWYPPMNHHNASTEGGFEDKFVIYDIASGKYDVKELVGLPADTDRVFHGLDIFERSPTELTIFAVNHRRTGSVIEVLEYKIGDKNVYYKETIKHDLIRTPNDIVALGPRSFYVSNDHLYSVGAWRLIEENLRRPWSNVIYYSPETAFVAFDHVISANGMTATTDRSLVYVSACHGGAIHVLKPKEDHTLVEQDHIKLDFYNDNPSFDPATGDVLITGHVKPLTMVAGLSVPNETFNGPSKIMKLAKNPLAETDKKAAKHVLETVLVDDGHLISTGTVAAIDRKRDVMLVGTAFSDRGLVRCPVPKGV
ncbi:Arylesterase-domain-containing protein [Dissophora ornata]|nr:Serum paraoxonase/arylesterase 2 [Dissophora ornata]KAI8596895.1 Arylesterase-domain-containing protein [Dissophora ornata]